MIVRYDPRKHIDINPSRNVLIFVCHFGAQDRERFKPATFGTETLDAPVESVPEPELEPEKGVGEGLISLLLFELNRFIIGTF